MSAVHALAATVAMTALFWVPYVLERMASQGLWAALGNPVPDAAVAPWAARAAAAHRNAVENLVLFTAAVGVAVALGQQGDPLVVGAAWVYLAARAAHFVVYALGVPVARTLTFAAGWAAVLAILVGSLS